MKILLLCSFFLSINISASAQDSEFRSPAQLVQDREVLEKAKSHSYRGGSEEGELRVQAQLPKPQRKISPVIDKKEMEKETQEHD